MMNETESLERFAEGLKRAASCARELGALSNLPAWKWVAQNFDNIRENGMKMAESKALSRAEVLDVLDKIHGVEVEKSEKRKLN